MTDLSGGPILFLNPAVLLPRLSPSVGADGFTITDVRNAPPQISGSADRLNELCRTVGAAVVLTNLDGIGDVRSRLERIGFRASSPTMWFTDPLLDPATGIAAWLAGAGGAPTHAIVDRPGIALAVTIRIDVPVGAEINAADARAATLALAAFA